MLEEKTRLLNNIKQSLASLPKTSQEAFSVFDADGTLWPQDINHILLEYLEKHKLRSVQDLLSSQFADSENRWKRCQFFAERQAGFSLEEFQHHCRCALEANPLTLFPFQKNLIEFLKSQSQHIYIVTSSLKELVKIWCEMQQLPIDKIFGIETRVDQGIITKEIIKPLTYGEGKKQALLNWTKNNKPVLAAGNTFNDLAMLEIAQISLVVNSAPKEHENFKDEQALAQLAKKQGWLLLDETG